VIGLWEDKNKMVNTLSLTSWNVELLENLQMLC